MDTDSFDLHREHSLVLRGLAALHFGTLFPVAMIGIWLSKKRWRQLWLLYGIAGLIAFSLVLFYVAGRYRFPMTPALILFAAAGLKGVFDLFRANQRLELACPFCCWRLV